MRASLVHSCPQQEKVAIEEAEPPAKSCKCRKIESYEKANEMVKEGIALWVVTARERGTQDVDCRACGGDKKVVNCAICGGTGKVTIPAVWNKHNGDIVLRRHKGAKNVSTSKAATIEKQHIEYAYVDGDAQAAARIEEYGMLTLEARAFPGPSECKHDKKFRCDRCTLDKGAKIYVIGVEPADDPKTGEGRRHDYGRSILYNPSVSRVNTPSIGTLHTLYKKEDLGEQNNG